MLRLKLKVVPKCSLDLGPKSEPTFRTMPNHSLYPEERRQAILSHLQAQGRVMVSELSEKFGVSEVTVRSDLQILAQQGKILRTHGGAVPAAPGLEDLRLERRRHQHPREKSHIGLAGAKLVGKGDAIFLDSSSTALAIAQHLKQHQYVTVLTSSLAVAQTLLNASGVTVVMPGGIVQRDTASLIDIEGLAYLGQFNIQKGFFGAHGLAIPEGLTDISAEVAAVKHELVHMCRQVIAVIDSSKWGRVGLATFASLDDIDVVLSDRDAPPDLVRKIRERGISVQLV